MHIVNQIFNVLSLLYICSVSYWYVFVLSSMHET